MSLYSLILKQNTMYKLTVREKDIMALIAQGLRTKQIAINLNIAASTVETHRKNIRKKLKLTSDDSLIHYAIVHGPKK